MFISILLSFIIIVLHITPGAFDQHASSWINKADKASDRGGLIGIFFWLSFSFSVFFRAYCRHLAVELLLEVIIGANYRNVRLFFSHCIAIICRFPGWLNSMPKSGGWLNSVMVALGFLELLLSNFYPMPI